MRKLFSSLALTLLSCLVLSSMAWGSSYDPAARSGNVPIPPASPMVLNHGGQGDFLFTELYRGMASNSTNFVSYFNIENTSNRYVAAHVRLRTGRWSTEAIDFPILLSPKDQFWFQLESVSDANGTVEDVVLYTADYGTAALSGFHKDDEWVDTGSYWTTSLETSLLDQFNSANPDLTTVNELTQGHLEVIGLFSWGVENNNPVDFYALMNELWLSQNQTQVGNPISTGLNGCTPGVPATDIHKDLMGQAFMGDYTAGMYTGMRMRAVQNFRSVSAWAGFADVYRDTTIRPTAGGLSPTSTIIYNVSVNGVQGPDPAYTNPDWATTFGPTPNDGNDYWGGSNVINNVANCVLPSVATYSLDEFEDATGKATIRSSFFNGGPTGETFTMTNITAITKYLHYYFNSRSGLTATGSNPTGSWPVGTTSTAKSLREGLTPSTVIAPMTLDGTVYDFDEKQLTGHSPDFFTNLDNQVNLIPIGDASREALGAFCFLVTSDVIDPFDSLYPSGWFEMTGFELVGDDPRNINGDGSFAPGTGVPSDTGYDRDAWGATTQTLLNAWRMNGAPNIIPISGYNMDFEFGQYNDARSYDYSWDNPTFFVNP